jgi:hypothetical protein
MSYSPSSANSGMPPFLPRNPPTHANHFDFAEAIDLLTCQRAFGER